MEQQHVTAQMNSKQETLYSKQQSFMESFHNIISLTKRRRFKIFIHRPATAGLNSAK
jgi:hypothetical protein